MTPSTNPGRRLERNLRNAGRRRRAVEKLRSDVANHLSEVVRDAAATGMSKTDIAETAGISRQTVHEMLRD